MSNSWVHSGWQGEYRWLELEGDVPASAVRMAFPELEQDRVVVEGPAHGFDSIPTGMYWAVVTMATVGYGDLSPATALGRLLTSTLIIIGYSIIVVPTGIYTAELARTMRGQHRRVQVRCPQCSLCEHDEDAWFCRKCGEALPPHD